MKNYLKMTEKELKKQSVRKIIDLADYIDVLEAKNTILRIRVKNKLTTPLTEKGLFDMARKMIDRKVLSFSTHVIQQKGNYPDIIWDFTKPQRIAYQGRLLDLESRLEREHHTLTLKLAKMRAIEASKKSRR